MSNILLEAALKYASFGWKVLPVVPNGKIPHTQHGVHDATTDIEQIKKWFSNNPNLNIGIATGADSGIIVYDIDPRNGGEDSWHEWCLENGKIPDGAMALTAGSGQHYIAKYVDGIRSCKLRNGIDLLSGGRYFVAYPSTIDGKKYEWEASSDPFDGIQPIDIPQQWLDSMQSKRLERISTNVDDLIQGDRNNGLTSLAGAMRQFGMKEPEILQALLVINDTRCSPSLPDSEVRQIARSVSRYYSDNDIAADTALGFESAELLLANNKASESDYFLTKATSFLSQPSPIQWIIKGWLPTKSISMIYGESGIGKSFIALDIACTIASGKQEWHGMKSSDGVVIYLAGEGNYGIRQRIASWAKHHDITNLDNLLISNKPIDLDSQGGAIKVIQAVREMTQKQITMVIVDTLNNHMLGDENSAQDTRAMINNSKIIGEALGCNVSFVHHTGVNELAKNRARGSSAWKGALDSSILISRDGEKIKVSCTKMKDAQESEPIYGDLSYVNLGWYDDEDDEIKGAVFLRDFNGEPEPIKKDSKYDIALKRFKQAWIELGCDVNKNGNPIIYRAAFATYLKEKGLFNSENSIKNQLSPSYENGIIGILSLSEIISCEKYQGKITNFEIVNDVISSAFLLEKSSSNKVT